ncbi:MAG: tetratricopeptide repeat protein [Flavobacteriales bacterium]
MKILNRLIVFGIIFSTALSASAESEVDSLFRVLEKAATDTGKIHLYYKLGNKLRQTDLNQTLLYYKKGLELSTKNNYKKGIAEGYHGIGVFHYYTSSFDSCKYYWEKSLVIKEKLNDMEGYCRSLNNLGVICRLNGDFDCAIANYNKVIDKLKNGGDKILLSNAYNNLGLVYETTGNYKKALSNFYASLKIDEEIKDDEGIAYTLNNIGLIHINLKNISEAKESFNTAYQLFKNLGDNIGMAMTVNNLGDTYADINEYQTAIDYFNRSLELEQEIGNINGMAFSYHSIGSLFLKKNETLKALKYIEKAYEFQNGEDIELLAKILMNLGKCHGILGNKKQQYHYYKEAHKLARANQLSKVLRDVSFNLYNYEYSYGNKLQALEYLNEYTRLNDSVFSRDNTRELTKIEMQFEFSKQKLQDSLEQVKKDLVVQEELKRQEIQLKAQRQFAVVVSSGFVLVLILAFVIYRGYKAKQKANEKISTAYEIIEEKNRDITDSIEYARYIQNAVIPAESEVIKAFRDAFVLFMPRDIVSGDFYWFYEDENYIMISAADCTGHGVPGALLAMLCSNIMNTAVAERKLYDPGQILTFTNKKLQQSVKRKNSTTQANDGMDLALCVIDKQNNLIKLATANNPLILMHKGVITTYKAENTPIGGNSPINHKYQTLAIPYHKDAVYYLHTDGYIDQFGGEKGKKFLSKRLKEELLKLEKTPMLKQKEILAKTFKIWKGEQDQIDDVTLIGFKL